MQQFVLTMKAAISPEVVYCSNSISPHGCGGKRKGAWQVGADAQRGKVVALLACAVKSLGQVWCCYHAEARRRVIVQRVN